RHQCRAGHARTGERTVPAAREKRHSGRHVGPGCRSGGAPVTARGRCAGRAGRCQRPLTIYPNTPALSIDKKNGRVCGVETARGYIRTDCVVLCTGIWGPLLAATVGEGLPLMPFEHPLMFFGPYDEFAGTGKEIGYPLFRDQGNSSYMRDTGDPTTSEGGNIEWGYYEQANPRLVYSRDIAESEDANKSPYMQDLYTEQILDGFERVV